MKSLLAVAVVLSFNTFAQADTSFTCGQISSKTGGETITVVEKNGEVEVSGGASGGMAHWGSSFGPFSATEESYADMTVYKFKDATGADQEIALTNSYIDGKFVRTATSTYGLWKDASLACN